MLTKDDILKIFHSYNLNSSNYGPTIYENNHELGICLDLKDSTFSYLTRAFIFSNSIDLDEFLKKYTWYKNNYKTYNVKLSLDNYENKKPQVKYYYQNQELTFNDMLNLNNIIDSNKQNIANNYLKNAYLLNIEALTNYLINLKNNNYNLKKEKNDLKIQENDLKYELLANLTLYYGKERTLAKKAVSLENIFSSTNDINLLKSNLQNIKTKNLDEIKNYLQTLINLIKEEELNDKNLINIYSNSIYKYNISILNKQIEFVKNKIAAEKNFNLKGSKLHNIDEELKSFLKNSPTPTKLNDYLDQNKNIINNKYLNLTDLTKAYSLISGNNLDIPQTKEEDNNLDFYFNNLENNIKNNLILYTSFYKDICNYIIDNNYPDLNTIKNKFDFTYYYNELDSIVHNVNNNHYLLNYFNHINFKTLDDYLNSIIDIAKTLENTNIPLNKSLEVFAISKNHKYQEMSLTPLYTSELTYLINIPTNTNIIYIPSKLIIDEKTNEIFLISSVSIYYQGYIKNTNDPIIVNKYHAHNIKDKKITITTDLILDNKYTFYKGELS